MILSVRKRSGAARIGESDNHYHVAQPWRQGCNFFLRVCSINTAVVAVDLLMLTIGYINEPRREYPAELSREWTRCLLVRLPKLGWVRLFEPQNETTPHNFSANSTAQTVDRLRLLSQIITLVFPTHAYHHRLSTPVSHTPNSLQPSVCETPTTPFNPNHRPTAWSRPALEGMHEPNQLVTTLCWSLCRLRRATGMALASPDESLEPTGFHLTRYPRSVVAGRPMRHCLFGTRCNQRQTDGQMPLRPHGQGNWLGCFAFLFDYRAPVVGGRR